MKLYFQVQLVGTITQFYGCGLWMEGDLDLVINDPIFHSFFNWMVDESNIGEDPPFPPELLDEDNWCIEEENGIKRGISIPAVHLFEKSISWRWR